jgi:cytochrome b561
MTAVAEPIPTSPAYRPVAKALHWLTALLVLATFPAGLVMAREGLDRGLQDALYIFHKNVGVAILALVAARLLYRRAHPPPPLPASVPPLQARIASATHWGLYLLLIVMAVSGYLRVKAGGFPVEGLDALGVPSLVPRSDALEAAAQAVHWWTRLAVAALVLMHVGAALLHAVVLRDGVFQRMWPGRGARP